MCGGCGHTALAIGGVPGIDGRRAPMPDSEPTSDSAKGDPSSSSRTREFPLDARARDEIVREAYRQLKVDSVASAGAAAAFSLLISLELSSAPVWGWLGYMLVVSGAGLWMAFAFLRQPKRKVDLSRWTSVFVGTTTAI